jgi:hypothetical protein
MGWSYGWCILWYCVELTWVYWEAGEGWEDPADGIWERTDEYYYIIIVMLSWYSLFLLIVSCYVYPSLCGRSSQMGSQEHKWVISCAPTVTLTDTYMPQRIGIFLIIWTTASHRAKAKSIVVTSIWYLCAECDWGCELFLHRWVPFRSLIGLTVLSASGSSNVCVAPLSCRVVIHGSMLGSGESKRGGARARARARVRLHQETSRLLNHILGSLFLV